MNNLVHIPGDKLTERVQGLTVQRLGRVAAVTPGLAGGTSAPAATLQSTLGHWPLFRGARQKDSPVRKRGKTRHKRGWNGVIGFFLCSPQHCQAWLPHDRRTKGFFSCHTLHKDSSHVLVPFRDSHTCVALSAGQGKAASALTRHTDTKCSLQCCWHSLHGDPGLLLLKQKPEFLTAKALCGRNKRQFVSWRP